MPRGIPNSKAKPAERTPEALPPLVILDENFGFMDNGCLRHWKEGEIVTVAADIAQLVARNAPLKDLGHG